METKHTSFKPTSTPITPAAKLWSIVALAAFAALVWGIWSFVHGPTTVVPTHELPDSEGTVSLELVQDDAYARARSWHSDAELSQVTTLESGANASGDARAWRFVFVSKSQSGVGFVIDVRPDGMSNGEEVAYSASGAPMPTNAKSKDDAIAEVRTLPGYNAVQVTGVEAIYNKDDHMLYWGVITSKGTISIRMEK